jgi:hypothetical protein
MLSREWVNMRRSVSELVREPRKIERTLHCGTV